MVGNIPNFTKIDVLRCFLRLNKNVGRKELAKELELGEGTIRTILDSLKSKKLLDSTKKGHFLSKKGNEVLSRLFNCISMPKNISIQNIYPEYKKIGIVIRNASNLRELYKLRDIAVKNGADGALILRYRKKLYTIDLDYSIDFNELEKNFDLRNDDVLVIAFSNAKRQAENGALAIAVEICDPVKNFINEA